MFILSTLSDTLFLPASSFNPSSNHSSLPATSHQSLTSAFNSKYANRVLPEVGLCIVLFDFLEVSEGKVKWGDGGLWHRVKARVVVFRPFVGEVLVGKVKSSDEGGIRVTMGFFDDVKIPPHLMPTPHAFDHQERAWFWLFSGEDEDLNRKYEDDPLSAPQDQRMYLDPGESIRFMVEDDIFEEGEPIPGLAATGGPAGASAGSSTMLAGAGRMVGSGVTMEAVEAARAKRKAPFRITGSIAAQGLGLVSWWATGQAQEEEYEDQAMEG